MQRCVDELVNRRTGRPLRIAHFAGIRDVDAALCSLPVDVSSLLCERSTVYDRSPWSAFNDFQASVSGLFREPLGDDFVRTAFAQMRSELLGLATGGCRRDFQRSESYLADATNMLSLVYSKPNSEIEWDGLQCGGAYLEGEEYNFLTQLARSANIRTAVETGAGESSICLHRAGVSVTSLEATPGPWLDRARKAGCNVIHVLFRHDECVFEQEAPGPRALGHAP